MHYRKALMRRRQHALQTAHQFPTYWASGAVLSAAIRERSSRGDPIAWVSPCRCGRQREFSIANAHKSGIMFTLIDAHFGVHQMVARDGALAQIVVNGENHHGKIRLRTSNISPARHGRGGFRIQRFSPPTMPKFNISLLWR